VTGIGVTRDCCPAGGNHAADCPTRCPACEYSGGVHAYDCPDLPEPESGAGHVSGPAEVLQHLAGPDPSIARTQKGSPMTIHSERQAYLEGADAAVDALSASAEAQRASGDMTRLAETETWLALAREDQAAAVAGVDAEQLAAMGAESVMTEPAACCGYPGRSQPATAVEAWHALQTEGPGAEAVQSYLAPGPVPRYDTPQARAEAQASASDREAGA